MRIEDRMDGDALADCIRRAQRGDAAAFDKLVELYAGRLFGFLYRLTASRQDAEDLMQEVFVRLVRMIGAYAHDGRFEAWIFRIASNLVRDRVRRAMRAPRMIGPAPARGVAAEGNGTDPLDELAVRGEDVDHGLVRGEELDALNVALAALPEAEREVVLLRHFSQMSFKDIAELMGTPLGTALARGHRALARLRELMGEDGGPRSSRTTSGAALQDV